LNSCFGDTMWVDLLTIWQRMVKLDHFIHWRDSYSSFWEKTNNNLNMFLSFNVVNNSTSPAMDGFIDYFITFHGTLHDSLWQCKSFYYDIIEEISNAQAIFLTVYLTHMIDVWDSLPKALLRYSLEDTIASTWECFHKIKNMTEASNRDTFSFHRIQMNEY
jgi:hypothetical protein